MAISNMDTLVAAMAAGDKVPYQKGTITSVANIFTSMWRVAGLPGAGAIPPTGVGEAPTRSTAGAMAGWSDPGGGALAYLSCLNLSTDDVGVYTLYDRLCHTSGLSGTVTTAQTINSAALTRYTDGIGVEAWIEIYAALGTTSRTATISYTNQAGTAGRTGTLTIPASAGIGRMLPFALDAGDTGVRSVETLTLSASTGTAGDFGIVLMKRIADAPSGTLYLYTPRDPLELGLPEIKSAACLAFVALTATTTVGPVLAITSIAKG